MHHNVTPDSNRAKAWQQVPPRTLVPQVNRIRITSGIKRLSVDQIGAAEAETNSIGSLAKSRSNVRNSSLSSMMTNKPIRGSNRDSGYRGSSGSFEI